MKKDFFDFSVFYHPWLSFYTDWFHAVFERESAMRRFIRHPSDIPISYSVDESTEYNDHLKDISHGGLCFLSESPLKTGSTIHIEIGIENNPFGADGEVAWCRPENSVYSVGVAFKDGSTQFGVRMAEQVCHIEQYRKIVLRDEGRTLNSEDAAKEWIEKHAADFPS